VRIGSVGHTITRLFEHRHCATALPVIPVIMTVILA
jgi:hypothetical protein